MWMRFTRTSVTPLRKQPKRLFYAGIKITIFLVGMQSVNPFSELSCSLLRETTQVWLLQLCFPSLTESGGIDGPRQFGALTFHTLVEKHGLFWTTLLVAHDILFVTVPSQPMLLHLSWLKMGNTRLWPQVISTCLLRSVWLMEGRNTRPSKYLWQFFTEGFTASLQHLKPGKAPGPDFICLELIIYAGAALKSWLRNFFSSCLRRLKIPKIWRRTLVVAIPKSIKPVGEPKSYRPISLLCFPYKILERLIYACVEPLIDPLLPKEQAGFRRGKSTVD